MEKKLLKFISMDLSTLLELERCGAKYEDGKRRRIFFDIMKEHDVDNPSSSVE